MSLKDARNGLVAGACVVVGGALALLIFGRRRRQATDAPAGWRIEADRSSLSDNLDDATLTLRLGIAVNAMRAAQRFYMATRDAPGPGGERDRFWSFLIAVGYLHEAIDMLRTRFPRVRELARKGGAKEECVAEVAALMSSRVPFTKTIRGNRNTLIFHWDDEPVRRYAQRFVQDHVVWADGVGDTQGESFYRAAADAVSNSILPDESALPDIPEADKRRIGELMRDVAVTTGKVIHLCDHAIIGHLRAHHPRQKPVS
jgi:hypothetical protein